MISEQADAVAKEHGIDLIKVGYKTTMMGMLFGIVQPGVFVAIAYFLGADREPTTLPNSFDMFFWTLMGLSVVGSAFGFYLRNRLLSGPLIKSENTFASDFAEGIKKSNIIVSSFHLAVAMYGLVLFFQGAEVEAAVLFAILSVIAFQILRFRGPQIEKSLVKQQEHVSAGRFLKEGGFLG